MYQARQNVVLQTANQEIITIRRAQIQYYSDLYVSLGTQAALIGGLANFVLPESQAFYVFDPYDVYQVCSQLSQLCSIYVVLTAMFLKIMVRK
jgi:hypothetical protein